MTVARHPTPLRPYLLALALAAVAASPVAGQNQRRAAPPPTDDAAPTLLSTKGHAPRFETPEQLIAAAQRGDDPVASFQYARLLEDGHLVPRNPGQALQFYEAAAAAGHAEATFRLGKIHHDALLGQPRNFARALDYYRRAAALGVPEAQYNIGAMLVSARGVRRDYVEGLAWLIVAAQNGATEGGVEQVKQRLARTPDRIAAGERRAAALAAQLRAGEPVEVRVTLAGAPATAQPPAAPPRPAPVAPTPYVPPRPEVTAPKATVPPPPVTIPPPR